MSDERPTWLPFARDDGAAITAALQQSGDIACPLCGRALERKGPVHGAWEVRCRPCRRHLVVRSSRA